MKTKYIIVFYSKLHKDKWCVGIADNPDQKLITTVKTFPTHLEATMHAIKEQASRGEINIIFFDKNKNKCLDGGKWDNRKEPA